MEAAYFSQLGQNRFAAGLYASAADAFRIASRLQPDPKSLCNLGWSLHMANRFDEALVAFRESLRLDPHDPTCLCNCAVTLLEIGQLDEAMASVDAGLAVAPNDADLLQCKGGILYHSGRREESLRFFDASNSSRITARATPELPQSRISISTSLGTLTE